MFFARSSRIVIALLLSITLLGSVPAAARDLVSEVTELDHMPLLPGHFPVPSDPNMLFYVQRSTNANTIVYAANLTAPGQIDPKKPVDAYWRRYAESGERRALYFFERILAFGVSSNPIPGHANEFEADVVAYPERKFSVNIGKSGLPEAILQIGGHSAKLVSAYLQLDESGLIPSLVYCDIYGIDQANGQVLHERLSPKSG
jgi:hypothetical protein